MTLSNTTRDIPLTCIREGETRPAHFVKIWEYIVEYYRIHGYPPSQTEMREQGFASSSKVMQYYLLQMQDLGMLHITPRVSRGAVPVKRAQWDKLATRAPRVFKYTRRKKKPHELR